MQLKRVSLFLALLASLLFFANGCHHGATVSGVTSPGVTAPLPPAVGPSAPPIKSPSGKTYARTTVGPPDDDEPVNKPPVPAGAAPNMDNFHGTARKAAKLSIVSGTPKSFSDIGTLLDSLVPDAKMRAMNISKGPDSDRVAQEKKVVMVTAFLYAASRESDNDFHCIVGRDPGKPARFMNVEVSALPPSSSPFFAKIRAVRNQFKTFFTTNGDGLPTQGYDRYDPPISIKVTGSLFFDVDHVPPAVGPKDMKPQSAWEIHPVSDIQFEQ